MIGLRLGLAFSPHEAHEARVARQIELSLLYAESRPSEVTAVDWIYALRKVGEYPAATPRSGKWIVFRDVGHIDGMWAKIKSATEAGRLGARSKVSTAKPSPLAIDQVNKIICVYTYDSDDVEDVMRVRQELRDMGVVEKIGYKTDAMTMAGKYVLRGAKPEEIRKYFE
jgi:Bles03-like protein